MHGDGASDAPAVLRATHRELVGVVGAEGCLISRVIGELLIEVAVRPDGKNLTLGPRLADPGLTVAPRSPVTPEVVAGSSPVAPVISASGRGISCARETDARAVLVAGVLSKADRNYITSTA
jgi:hypothetical protein